MLEEQENQSQEVVNEEVGTDTTDTENSVSDESTEEVSKEDIKTFTQEKVNEIVKERLARQEKQFYSKFGVESEKEFENLIGMSQSYEVMKERYENIKLANDKDKQELAFIKNNVNPNKYDDVLTYFKGKEIEFSADELVKALETHPEWKNYETDRETKTTITSLGTEPTRKVGESDEEKIKRIFGI